jgi:hypothetical protein
MSFEVVWSVGKRLMAEVTFDFAISMYSIDVSSEIASFSKTSSTLSARIFLFMPPYVLPRKISRLNYVTR